MAQPDLHPDADLLNAFAEHALPEAERARVVAHMAGCGRCREVVFLAQAAAEPESVPPVLKPEPRPGWFSAAFTKWRVALIPATALAAAGGIVLWVQVHPVAPVTRMAELVPPTAPPSSQAAPPQSAARRAEPTASGREETAIANNALSSAASSWHVERAPGLQHENAPAGVAAIDKLARTDASKATALSAPAAQGRGVDGIHLDGRSAATARYAAPPPDAFGSASVATFSAAPPAPEGQQPPMTASQQAAGTVDSAGVPMLPAPAPAPPNIVAVHGGPVASSGAAQIAAPPSPNVELAPQPMNGPAVMRLARRTKLPSGLNTVSSAALLNRLVAVDSAGGVFQSQDGGKRWEAVPPHWTGKAVQVQAPPHGHYALMSATETQPPELSSVSSQAPVAGAPEESPAPPPAPAANAALSPVTPSAKAKAAPPVLPLQFKLVTDRHEVWVSADGKVWREQ